METGPDGRRVFVELPPTMTHVDEENHHHLEGLLTQYAAQSRADWELFRTRRMAPS